MGIIHSHEINVSHQKPTISKDVFDRLDDFHRAMAIVLARHGEIIIEGGV